MNVIDLVPPKYELRLYRGNKSGVELAVVGEDLFTAINLSGATIQFDIAKRRGSPRLYSMTVGNGLTVAPLTGIVMWQMNPAAWAIMTETSYVADLDIYFAGDSLPTTGATFDISIVTEVSNAP
jgi:hypothetical protein